MVSHLESEETCCGGCAASPVLPRQVAWLQGITLAWMVLECGGSLWAAARAHSAALLAFGSDSLVEMMSATVVLLQFLPRFPLKKSQADYALIVPQKKALEEQLRTVDKRFEEERKKEFAEIRDSHQKELEKIKEKTEAMTAQFAANQTLQAEVVKETTLRQKEKRAFDEKVAELTKMLDSHLG